VINLYVFDNLNQIQYSRAYFQFPDNVLFARCSNISKLLVSHTGKKIQEPNFVAEWLDPAVHSSGPTFDYGPTEQPILNAGVSYFPQFLQANAETTSQQRPEPGPSIYVLLHLSESSHQLTMYNPSSSLSSSSCQVLAMWPVTVSCHHSSSPTTFLSLLGLYTTIQFLPLIHSYSSLSYDRSVASSKVSSPQIAI
jgi:hypothetical protein